MRSKKQLDNLIPIKKGQRIAAKPADQRKDFRLHGRVEPVNLEEAKRLLEEMGSKTKVINGLLRMSRELRDK